MASEELKKKLCQRCNAQFPDEPCEPSECALLAAIENAVEVVHGRWKWGRNSMNQYGAWCTECECGWEDKGNDFDRVQGLVIAHKYCPNCGAKMDGERRSDD